MDPDLVRLGVEALQRQEYPDHEDWFYDVQTVNQLVDLLMQLAAADEVIE